MISPMKYCEGTPCCSQFGIGSPQRLRFLRGGCSRCSMNTPPPRGIAISRRFIIDLLDVYDGDSRRFEMKSDFEPS
ncbi:unnamed protein product [Nippostrongylus brasiliensis]|uniref:Uncharacterized protein n=1 Tax=Nippostrongylus brasiliensis TaxID=27835 RepID=A0A0N4Y3P3_NIPBR|nr:unnamed protein product [Nippostrongylus brasiliensis]